MTGPTSGSATSRGSTSRIGDDLVTAVEQVERPLPAGLADEVRDDEHERPALDRLVAGVEQRREVGERRAGRGAAGGAGRRRAAGPGSGRCRPGSSGSTRSPYSTAPTRLPRRVSSRASVVTKSISTVRFWRSASAVPKSTDGLRSSRNQAVSSRSSVYSRTYGASIRAVTFQSMYRTSSPGWYSRRSARSTP